MHVTQAVRVTLCGWPLMFELSVATRITWLVWTQSAHGLPPAAPGAVVTATVVCKAVPLSCASQADCTSDGCAKRLLQLSFLRLLYWLICSSHCMLLCVMSCMQLVSTQSFVAAVCMLAQGNVCHYLHVTARLSTTTCATPHFSSSASQQLQTQHRTGSVALPALSTAPLASTPLAASPLTDTHTLPIS